MPEKSIFRGEHNDVPLGKEPGGNILDNSCQSQFFGLVAIPIPDLRNSTHTVLFHSCNQQLIYIDPLVMPSLRLTALTGISGLSTFEGYRSTPLL